jgi:hypothetical protein
MERHDPSPEFFRNLKDQLPGFKQELEKKRVLKGQTPVEEMVPKKCCTVCGKGFDWGRIKGPIPELAVCDKCQAKLDAGETALKSDNRYAFIKSASLADMAGQIMQVSPDVMDKVQTHYMAEWVEGMEEKPKQLEIPNGFKIATDLSKNREDEDMTEGKTGASDQSRPYILLLSNAGQLFTSQVGGFGCLHPVERGFLLEGDDGFVKANRLVEEFVYGTHDGWCVPEGHFFVEEQGDKVLFSESDADEVDRIMAAAGFENIKVDRERLGKCCEAWIYCKIDGKPCVLITWNSD